jgi:hypothetical protein
VSNFVKDNCRILGTSLTTTNNTAVYTAPSVGYVQVIGVRISNITALDATASVRWFDSSANVSFCLTFQHTVPANGAVWLPLEAFAPDASDEIRVQAGTANALDVIVSITESPGRSG